MVIDWLTTVRAQAKTTAKKYGGLVQAIPGFICTDKTQFLWVCAGGHAWTAAVRSAHKYWCPHCRLARRGVWAVLKILVAKGMASNISCSASTSEIFSWQCSNKHVWVAGAAEFLANGGECDRCKLNSVIIR